MYYNIFDKLFQDIADCGADLVFFSDLNLQESKMDEWLNRADQDYERQIELFDQIARHALSFVVNKRHQSCAILISWATDILVEMARKHGVVHYATANECDRELAKYARDHNAMAVFTDDSDFLIYEGNFRFWLTADIDLNLLLTTEYSRTALFKHFGLEGEKLALLATLMGNDFTKSTYKDELWEFHKSLGQTSLKAYHIRDFIRSLNVGPRHLTSSDISEILPRVFPHLTDTDILCDVFMKSIQSYNLDFTIEPVDDPFTKLLMHYRLLYLYSISTVHRMKVYFNDLRCKDKPYSDFGTRILGKFCGIFNYHKANDERPTTIKVGLKTTHEEKYRWSFEPVTYPPCEFNINCLNMN